MEDARAPCAVCLCLGQPISVCGNGHVICGECVVDYLCFSLNIAVKKHVACPVCPFLYRTASLVETAVMWSRPAYETVSCPSGLVREENRILELLTKAAIEGAMDSHAEMTMRTRLEDALTMRCPVCMSCWDSFDGCIALTCSSCHSQFCALCLTICEDDVHAHCLRKHGGLFIRGDIAAYHVSHKEEAIAGVLASLPESSADMLLFETCADLLKLIGINTKKVCARVRAIRGWEGANRGDLRKKKVRVCLTTTSSGVRMNGRRRRENAAQMHALHAV